MLLSAIVAALLASGVSFALCRALIAAGPLDVPSESRKAHATPTPTSGGLAIAGGALAGHFALRLPPTDASHVELWWLWLVPCSFLLIGYVDDMRGLPARAKAIMFLALSLIGALGAGAIESFPLHRDLALAVPTAIGVAGVVLWVFTLVNAVNFIDGANGVAAGSMAIATAGAGVIAWTAGAPTLASAALCVVAAILGFLVWNLPSGRIFAGDSGALSLGAFGALLSLALIDRTGLSPFVPPILFFPILADVLLTLLWRARRGARLLEAHADHLYQLGLRIWRSHLRVALAFWTAMALCGVLAIFVARHPDPSLSWKALAALAIGAAIVSEAVRRRAR